MIKIFKVLLEDAEYSVKVCKRKNCKKFILKFNPKAKIFKISMPYFVSYEKAMNFFYGNQAWAILQIKKSGNIDFANLDSVFYKGVSYKIYYVLAKRNKAMVDHNLKVITIEYKTLENKEIILTKLLRNEAKAYFKELSTLKANKIGVAFNNVSVTDTLTKWGSCSSMKNLRYNFRLLMAPLYVIDYIVAHEVAHLKEFNHSKNFWNLVNFLTPYEEEAKLWLKTQGKQLY